MMMRPNITYPFRCWAWCLVVPMVLLSCAGEVDDAGAAAQSADPGPKTLPGTDADWAIMQEQARWAYANGLDSLPIGQVVARIGQQFVGTPYAPHTLEVAGVESLVI